MQFMRRKNSRQSFYVPLPVKQQEQLARARTQTVFPAEQFGCTGTGPFKQLGCWRAYSFDFVLYANNQVLVDAFSRLLLVVSNCSRHRLLTLHAMITIVDKTVLTAALAADFKKINFVEQTGSTNADLLEPGFNPSGAAGPALLWAAHQTAGRGRRGATWLDQAGRSLTFSIAFERLATPRLPTPMSAFSLVTGLVIATQIESAMPRLNGQLRVKWPNDVLVGTRKAVGILSEAKMRGGLERIVVGCGINLVIPEHLIVDPGSLAGAGLLDRPADWTDEESQQLIANIALALKSAFDHFCTKGFEPFQSDWDRYDAFANQWIELRENGQLLASGRCCGVDSTGAIRVDSDGIIDAYSIGVASARSGTAPIANR